MIYDIQNSYKRVTVATIKPNILHLEISQLIKWDSLLNKTRIKGIIILEVGFNKHDGYTNE